MAKISLEKIPLLAGLAKSETALLGNFLIEKKYPADVYLYQDQKAADRLIIVASGQAGLEAQVGSEKQIIALFNKCEFIGENSLLNNILYHRHSLKALKALTTLELSQRHWPKIIKQAPKIAEKIYKNTAGILYQRLEHADNKLTALFAISQAISRQSNLNNIAGFVLDIILNVIPSQAAIFMTYSQTTDKLHVYRSLNFKDIKDRAYYPAAAFPIFQDLVRHPRTLILGPNDWPSKNLLWPGQTKSTMIIAPICLTQKAIGFIVLKNKRYGQEYSANNQILLEAVAAQLAAIIQHSRLIGLEEATADLKKAYIDPLA
ncbi:MAG: cyclic nucleotide-binding domain-containing protein [Patescibacteria group bacterium]